MFNMESQKRFYEKLFMELYSAPTESEVDQIIQRYPEIFKQENWTPYGNSENYFGVIENQQASPVPALVEKITNSIDAILMKKCYEAGIQPDTPQAPMSIEEAVKRFFPEHKNWDMIPERKKQAESIQVIADGEKLRPSLIIFDEGEGQHPVDFEDTFLSLLHGNKNEIHFVQGKYNMGGSGAVVFCGKKRYQLIASKRYEGNGEFGFTLVRKHPLSKTEMIKKKNTWYEFLKPTGQIPSFEIEELDIKLYKRKFSFGTIIKLYSYDLPTGSRSVISRDLNQSLNEYLFEPALPIYTIDKKERYPLDKGLERDLYGLKRRLEESSSKYVEEYFVENYSNEAIGHVKVTCYIFKTKVEDKDAKKSKETIRDEFFKNNMAVLFSLNGQVHGHFTSEFITRALKFHILKDYLLVHVDCTGIKYDFRSQLFMASRDRLKEGDESRELREFLSQKLKKSRLADIYKKRKSAFSIEGGDAGELLKSYTKNLPLHSDLMKLLDQTFKIEENIKEKQKKGEQKSLSATNRKEKIPFKPKRFPSYFKLNTRVESDKPITQIPLNGNRTVKFLSDVENQYFVRVEEPGDLQMAIVDHVPKTQSVSDSSEKTESNTNIDEIFNVDRSSPHEGTIKVVLNPTKKALVGDALRIRAMLTNPGNDFEQFFWVKISEPESQEQSSKKNPDLEKAKMGLPAYTLLYRDINEAEHKENKITWKDFGEKTGEPMDYGNVLYPFVDEDDKLANVFINMDSSILKDYKSSLRSEEQLETAEKRYIASVYFHTLFLFTIAQKKNYSFSQKEEHQEKGKEIELTTFIRDLFDNYYAQFLLSFGIDTLIDSLD